MSIGNIHIVHILLAEALLPQSRLSVIQLAILWELGKEEGKISRSRIWIWEL